VNKETPLPATRDEGHETRKDRDRLTHDALAAQAQRPLDHSVEQTPSNLGPAPTRAAELEAPEIELGLIL
jgi:hypothetical protein